MSNVVLCVVLETRLWVLLVNSQLKRTEVLKNPVRTVSSIIFLAVAYLISSPAKSKTLVMVTLGGSAAFASFLSGDASSPAGFS